MGTWSGEPFGSDDASDFAWELDAVSDWSVVTGALDEALEAEEELDSDLAVRAIAAAEMVAHGLGRPTQTDAYTESVQSFVQRAPKPTAELVAKARAAMAKATAADSELRELWEEEEPGEWNEANARLIAALSGD